ncbi:nondiscriminating glutamyl-tRNA synthetase [Thermosyntropha lipolytica DSM 11003]|uniref:Glutamate--tRNA ligase n=1 Tax=Thermosyntropha lipolytica DSM 11003 TaxID=1123382 RepID=A0A1M5NRI2_9FIRM|nr:glutamate--tRNA ligase [Thermosyntropha lipolytica]SHG92078.1 nondiscriminating glutamyl-tRNA synthetase [Thermosyntropha lipolytica DSM 11003]
MKKVKVRFAPSPTGPLHIGGARSALFNYLFAKRYDGEMVLRIEDTDLERSRPEYEKEIIDSLRWLGISWTEGVDIGGDNGPYRQTERISVYREYVEKLLASGQAYECFCSEEELEKEREELLAKGEMVRYSGKCRYLTPEEREEKLKQGIKPAIRFKVPDNKVYVVNDLVRGKVAFETGNIGDFIIMKSDGIPTYNFAVVVDDALMGITHVIRAEEHLSNTPRQLMLYEALNFKVPEFAHISLILGSDRQKMSKRHGATSLIQYREKGYLPEAMYNFLALLGWSPEGEEEILTPEQINKSFSLDRVSKSPAVFDLDKLNHINQQHIKMLSLDRLKELLRPYLEASPYGEKIASLGPEKYELLVMALRDYLVCLSDIVEHARIILEDIEYEDEALQVLKGEHIKDLLLQFIDEYPPVDGVEEIKQYMKSLVKKTKLKPKDVFMPIRCALSGKTHGPDLPYLISIWGREEVQRRVRKTLEIIDRK